MTRWLSFNDLVQANIVTNRVTLRRWIATRGFPKGRMLGENTRRWREDEVERWLAAQPEPGAAKFGGNRR